MLGSILSAALTAALFGGGDQHGAVTPPMDPPTWTAPAHERLVDAVVLEVLDGDSLVLMVDGQVRRYEILGADAPEWVARAATPRPYSAEARRFLTNMLLSEQVAVFEPTPDATDPLGRRQAHVFRLPDMAFVDLEIVRQGYGKVGTRASDAYAPVLRWYEQRAREMDRGVWDRTLDPEPEPAAQPARPAPAPPEARPQTAEPKAEPAPKPRTEPKPEPGWVWVTRSGSKYHREGCSHLTSTRTRVRIDTVSSTHEPCRTCSPNGS